MVVAAPPRRAAPVRVLLHAGEPLQCPHCARRIGGRVRPLPGSTGGVLLPIRCPRSQCRAYLEFVVVACTHQAATACPTAPHPVL